MAPPVHNQIVRRATSLVFRHGFASQGNEYFVVQGHRGVDEPVDQQHSNRCGWVCESGVDVHADGCVDPENSASCLIHAHRMDAHKASTKNAGIVRHCQRTQKVSVFFRQNLT